MHPTSKLAFGLAVVAVCLIGWAPGCNGAPSENYALSSIANPHIVDGEYVEIEKIPYQISIEALRMHMCGGAIVSEEWIVTAAHCVYSGISGPKWFKRVRAGSTTEIPIFGTGGTIYQIAEAKYHPKFDIQTIDYDVGVIKTTTRIMFGDRIQPIPVPSTKEENFVDYSATATTSGWGLTKPGGWFPSLWLKKVTIPLVNREECFKRHEGQINNVTPRMICGAATGNGSACQGDSGGPVVQKDRLIGLVSWGIRCNDEKLPNVFTNVLDVEVREYIKTNTGV